MKKLDEFSKAVFLNDLCSQLKDIDRKLVYDRETWSWTLLDGELHYLKSFTDFRELIRFLRKTYKLSCLED